MASCQMLAQVGWFLAWYNVIFVALVGVGLFFTLRQIIGSDHDDDDPAGAHPNTNAGTLAARISAWSQMPAATSFMLLGYTTGITGWIGNALLRPLLGDSRLFFPPSFLLALAAGFLVLRFARTFTIKHCPTLATGEFRKRRLLKLTAKAVLPINQQFGQACLYDQHGALRVVGCRVPDGAADIEKGAAVVLLNYLEEHDLFEVGRV